MVQEVEEMTKALSTPLHSIPLYMHAQIVWAVVPKKGVCKKGWQPLISMVLLAQLGRVLFPEFWGTSVVSMA